MENVINNLAALSNGELINYRNELKINKKILINILVFFYFILETSRYVNAFVLSMVMTLMVIEGAVFSYMFISNR